MFPAKASRISTHADTPKGGETPKGLIWGGVASAIDIRLGSDKMCDEISEWVED